MKELCDWEPWLDDCWLNPPKLEIPPKLGMKGCITLINGLMDCEKLLKEELCWDCWMNDWKVGAICWKAREQNKSLAFRPSKSQNR